MSITDELREWAHERFVGLLSSEWEREVDGIADRIDEQHAKARDKAYDELREFTRLMAHYGLADKFTRDKLTEIADRIDQKAEGVYDAIDADKNAMGYVKLPVDADGVPIHIGDVMEGEKIGGGFGEPFEVVGYIMSNGEFEPMDEHKCPRKRVYLRHHHEPTVEDVLREFFSRYVTTKPKDEDDAILAEYAAKLRLAEEDE